MRKTIFALALFTVILSFYVSKAELFLEDVELVEFEDEELITTKPSATKGSDDKKKDTKTKNPKKTDGKTTPPKKTDGKTTPPKDDKKKDDKKKDKTKNPKKTDGKTTPNKKTAPKKSSTMKWVIIAVVVVLVGVAIWYFACRGDDTEAKKDKTFKEGKEADH